MRQGRIAPRSPRNPHDTDVSAALHEKIPDLRGVRKAFMIIQNEFAWLVA
jgi:hypothetical protein